MKITYDKTSDTFFLNRKAIRHSEALAFFQSEVSIQWTKSAYAAIESFEQGIALA